jgi:hypothetical protein
VAEFQKALQLDEGDIGLRASLGQAYAVAGKREEAEAILSELMDASKQKYVSPYFMVEILAALGQTDAAFEWLERCYSARAPHLVFLNVEPKLNPLKADTRFENLLKRMNLTK